MKEDKKEKLVKKNVKSEDKKDKTKTKKSKERKTEKKPNKFIEIIKKKWLVDGTKTCILVLAIIMTIGAPAALVAFHIIIRNNLRY